MEAHTSTVVKTSEQASLVNVSLEKVPSNETEVISEINQTEEFKVQARRQKAYSASLGKVGDGARSARRRNLRTISVHSRPVSSNQTVNVVIPTTVGITSADSTWSDNSETEDNSNNIQENSISYQNSQSGRRDSFKWDSDEDEQGHTFSYVSNLFKS